MAMTYTSKKSIADAIRSQITTNDKVAVKAMLRVYEYQTADEQEYRIVRNNNGVGFTSNDAELLTAFCKQYLGKGYLTARQYEILRGKIGKYAVQLTNQAISKGLYQKVGKEWIVVNR